MSKSRRCPYCQCSFLPSVYRPQQVVCSQAECQRQRRSDYHRQKLRTDPEYGQVARDSQRKWRQAHPDYLRQYLAQHAQAVEQNRQRNCVTKSGTRPELRLEESPDQAAVTVVTRKREIKFRRERWTKTCQNPVAQRRHGKRARQGRVSAF